TFTSDTCSFNVPNIGTIALRIVEREPAKTVKLVTEKSPVPFTCWIQLTQAAPEDTRLKLTLRADIPFMLKGMVSKPLENMVQKVAEALAALPY
ncbi:MAG: SRPBCC family protein, partial [Bacteroidota bacterium]|nr:SRPBCC family protein [Bacteroidota bacterium]